MKLWKYTLKSTFYYILKIHLKIIFLWNFENGFVILSISNNKEPFPGPSSIKLKIFPNYIKLKAIVSLDDYNDILEDDFVITADYKFLNKKFSSLSLFLVEYPIKVKNVNWQPKTVNYLIRKWILLD